MTLEWIEHDARDAEGDRHHTYYLVDPATSLCYATIEAPRVGNLLYTTDLRIAGADRSYLNVEAAKAHCEHAAQLHEIEEARKFEASVPPTPDEPKGLKKLLAKWLA